MSKMKNLLHAYQKCGDGLYHKVVHFGDQPVTLVRDASGHLVGRGRLHPSRVLSEMPDEINRNRRMDGRPSYAR